jgi:uncharacterized protein with von Willebrand factor type A (vWA) domain
LLVYRHEDLAFFDDAFDRFWRARGRGGDALPLFSLGERPRIVSTPTAGTQVQFDSDGADGGTTRAAPLAVGAWSSVESLRTRDFNDLTPEELARAEALIETLPWRLGVRRTRRWKRSTKGAIDLRPIIRLNMKYGGELIDLPRRTRRDKPRPIVVLADVSGSMERYARVLLQFVCAMATGTHDVESFVFATRLTRITRAVARKGTAGALRAVTRDVQDWGGGTRIGDALRAFNVHWARRVMRHDPVVLIVSDGWDRGDPAMLARELARVRRTCHRLIWLNPLLGSSRYEPLTRGMQAAMPLIDDFLPAHNLVSLEQLAAHLRTLTAGHGSPGHVHVQRAAR